MRTTHSTGFIAVTLTITLLALEAVAVFGLVRVTSSWTPPRIAALARAGATTWSALTRSAQRTMVNQTLPAALAVVRTTTDVMRAANHLWPALGTQDARPRQASERHAAVAGVDDPPKGSAASRVEVIAIVRTPVPQQSVVHACPSQKASTRVVCTRVSRSRNSS